MQQPAADSLPVKQPMEWGRFPFEVLLWAVPVVTAWALFIELTIGRWWLLNQIDLSPAIAADLLIFTGAVWIVRTWYRYHGEYKNATICALIQNTEVSQMRACAVRLEGEIVGLGVPGVFWCPDLVLRDATGMLFILYRQSIPFARFLFALMSADRLIGQHVVIEGWFRRGLRPYIEVASLTTEQGTTKRAWSRWV